MDFIYFWIEFCFMVDLEAKYSVASSGRHAHACSVSKSGPSDLEPSPTKMRSYVRRKDGSDTDRSHQDETPFRV